MVVLERELLAGERVAWKEENTTVKCGGLHPRTFYGEGPFVIASIEQNPAYDIQYAVVQRINGEEVLPPIQIGWFKASR